MTHVDVRYVNAPLVRYSVLHIIRISTTQFLIVLGNLTTTSVRQRSSVILYCLRFMSCSNLFFDVFTMLRFVHLQPKGGTCFLCDVIKVS